MNSADLGRYTTTQGPLLNVTRLRLREHNNNARWKARATRDTLHTLHMQPRSLPQGLETFSSPQTERGKTPLDLCCTLFNALLSTAGGPAQSNDGKGRRRDRGFQRWWKESAGHQFHCGPGGGRGAGRAGIKGSLGPQWDPAHLILEGDRIVQWGHGKPKRMSQKSTLPVWKARCPACKMRPA
jgi:hypothetical protein